jgi:hypothetical protein
VTQMWGLDLDGDSRLRVVRVVEFRPHWQEVSEVSPRQRSRRRTKEQSREAGDPPQHRGFSVMLARSVVNDGVFCNWTCLSAVERTRLRHVESSLHHVSHEAYSQA